jgi:hypothetical protein
MVANADCSTHIKASQAIDIRIEGLVKVVNKGGGNFFGAHG